MSSTETDNVDAGQKMAVDRPSIGRDKSSKQTDTSVVDKWPANEDIHRTAHIFSSTCGTHDNLGPGTQRME